MTQEEIIRFFSVMLGGLGLTFAGGEQNAIPLYKGNGLSKGVFIDSQS